MLVKQSLIYGVARGVPGLVTFAAIAAYTRLLAPAEYGSYALAAAWVLLAGAVFFQWMRLGLTRFLAGYEHGQARFVSTLAAGFAGMLLLTGIAGAGLLLFLDGPARLLTGAALLLFWVQSWYELVLEHYRARIRPVVYGVFAISKALLGAGCGIAFVALGWGAPGLLLGMITGMLLPLLWVARSGVKLLRLRHVDWPLFRRLLVYGLPLTATFALEFIIASSDRIILTVFIGAHGAGVYAVGFDLAKQSLGLMMMVVNTAAFPLAVKALGEKSRGELTAQLRSNALVLLAVAVPAAAGLAVLSPHIAAVLLGARFRDGAAFIMPWIALGTLLAGIKMYHFDRSFQLSSRTVTQIWVALSAAVVSIGLNMWLIPALGMAGAAYANVAAYTAALTLSILLGRRRMAMPFPLADAAKIAGAAAMMCAVLWPLRQSAGVVWLLSEVALGAAVYAAGIVAFNVGGLRRRAAQTLRLRWHGLRGETRADP